MADTAVNVADQGGGAEPQREGFGDWCGQLYKSLTGKGISANTKQILSDRADALSDALDADALPDDDALGALRYNEDGSHVGELMAQQPDPPKKLKRIRTKLRSLRKKETLSDKLKAEFTGKLTELKANIEKIQEDRQSNGQPLSEMEKAELEYVNMAERLMAEEKHGMAVDFLLDAVDIRHLRETETATPLKYEVLRCQEDLRALGVRLARLSSYVLALPAEALSEKKMKACNKDRADANTKHDEAEKLIPTLPREDDTYATQAEIQMCRDARRMIAEGMALLDAAEKPLHEAVGKKHATKLKAFGDMCEVHGGKIERTGGDWDGGGAVVPKGKYAAVPEEKFQEMAASIELLGSLSEEGTFQGSHARMIKALEDDISKQMTDINTNLKRYEKLDGRIKDLGKTLAKKDYQYWGARKEELLADIETAKGTIASNLTAAETQVQAIETAVDKELPQFQAQRKDYDDLMDLKDEVEKDFVKAVESEARHLLGRLKDIDDPTEGVHRGLWKRLRRVHDFEGAQAIGFRAACANLIDDDQESRTEMRIALRRVQTEGQEQLATIRKLAAAIKVTDKKAEGLSAENLILLSGVIDDMANSAQELKDQQAQKELFEQKSKELKDFVDSHTSTALKFWKENRIEKDAYTALTNHGVMLKALKSRAKGASGSAEWKDLVKEVEELHTSAKELSELYKVEEKAKASGDKTKEIVQAAQVIAKVHVSIGELAGRLRSFPAGKVIGAKPEYEKALDALPDGADAPIGTRTEREHLTALIDLIDRKGGALNGFMADLADHVKATGLNKLAERLLAAETSPEEIAIREEAVAELRRRRLLFEEVKTGLIYRDNPFDNGAIATAAIRILGKAESDLLTLIKQRKVKKKKKKD